MVLFSISCSSCLAEKAVNSELDVSTFGEGESEPTALPSISVDATTATIECDASSTTSGGLLAVQCPSGAAETLYTACDGGEVVISSASSGDGTKYDCSSAEIICNDSGEISSTVADGCTGTTVDVADYINGDSSDTDINLTGTVAGQSVDLVLSEGDVSFLVLDLNNSRTYDANDIGIDVTLDALTLNDTQSISGFITLKTYNNFTDDSQYTYSGSSAVSGYITIIDTGVTTYYTIESVTLNIETVDLTYGQANITGNLVIALASSEGELTLDVSAGISFGMGAGI